MDTTNTLKDGRKSRLRNYIISGARNYRHYLTDKIFKIVCEDGCETEVRFFPSDFKHLTGLQSDLDDISFYNNCISGKISIGNIKTYQKYNWSTLLRKCMRIQNIQDLLYKDDQKTLLLECLDTRTYVYPCAIRDDKNDICIGFVGASCKARSLRKATSSLNATAIKKIIAILAKNDGDEKFSELVYISNVLTLYGKNSSLFDELEENIHSKFSKLITEQDYDCDEDVN